MKVFAPRGESPDPGALMQISTCLLDDRAVDGALMADHHLGYSMPIGGVVAYHDAISPTGVGFDIACGNMAVRTDLHASRVKVLDAMQEIQEQIEFGIGRRMVDLVEHDLFDDPAWGEIDKQFGADLKLKARQQLGTVGSGNHYVDLLADEDGTLWVANHFGSRGLGHTLASGFMAGAQARSFTDRVPETETPIVFGTDTGLGQFYVQAMELAGRYAYAGREHVTGHVLEILGAKAEFTVHNHHNYAWFENDLWVVRKGATPLTSEPAFIGGSMGDLSVIVRGTGDDIGALNSAPHGAGRVMSRTKAAGKWKKETVTRTAPDGTAYTKKIRVRDKTTALIDWDTEHARLADEGIVVLGAGADESPGVYKSLETVLAAHSNIEILHRLQPIGVVMAGEDTFDPYKD